MTAHSRRWTAAQVRALGVRTDLRTAGSIFGMSPTQCYEAAKADRLPFPVLRVGIRYVVPVAPILELLGLDGGGTISRLPSADQRELDHEAQSGQVPAANGTAGP